MEKADQIAAVDKYVQAFAESNMDIIREIYAEDAVVEDPVGSEPHVGMDAIVEFYSASLPTETVLELTGNPRCAGNSVAFPFNAVVGDMRIEIIDVFEFNDEGKIASMKAYWSF